METMKRKWGKPVTEVQRFVPQFCTGNCYTLHAPWQEANGVPMLQWTNQTGFTYYYETADKNDPIVGYMEQAFANAPSYNSLGENSVTHEKWWNLKPDIKHPNGVEIVLHMDSAPIYKGDDELASLYRAGAGYTYEFYKFTDSKTGDVYYTHNTGYDTNAS